MKLPADYTRLTPVQRREVRLQYVQEQQGKCWYCKGDLEHPPAKEVQGKWIYHRLFPAGFFAHKVHLHHNHDTGMTIGAVHAYCNAVLWQYHGQ